MRTSELLAKVEMKPVRAARNLRAIGWADGYMVVRFWTGEAQWVYGPNLGREEMDKILRVPFPDAQFQKAVKAKFKSFKINVSTI